MEIRHACVGDAERIAALEEICLFADPWGREALASSIGDTDCVTLVALAAGEIVGYVTGRIIPPEAELYRICTHPAAQRRGIARALADAFHSSLAGRGCDTCFLEVRASNEAARSLYRAIGYTECGVRRNYYRAPVEDAILNVLKF